MSDLTATVCIWRAPVIGLFAALGTVSPVGAQAKLFAYEAPTSATFADSLMGGEPWADFDGDLDAVIMGMSGARILVNDGTVGSCFRGRDPEARLVGRERFEQHRSRGSRLRRRS